MTLQEKFSKGILFKKHKFRTLLSSRARQFFHLLDQHVVMAQSSTGHEPS